MDGGSVARAVDIAAPSSDAPSALVRFPFATAAGLLRQARQHDLQIDQLMRANEHAWRSDGATRDELLRIWQVMDASIQQGLTTFGVLPGVLKGERRAASLYRQLTEATAAEPQKVSDWVSVAAIAVGEENASGGRIVVAPTCGVAGIVAAVLAYYRRFECGADDEGILRYLLAAGAIALIYKESASLFGAPVGYQGAVGVACSMAAAGLTAALGGTNEQIECAAAIAMADNLGLTCDPVAGLVQIPCIDRNAMAAVKAIEAARMALRGDSSQQAPLDQLIATMHQASHAMQSIYKESSRGGLTVNVLEC